MPIKMTLKQINRIETLARCQGRPFCGLVVDDEPLVGTTLREFLLLSPLMEVHVAANGVEALELMRDNHYDFATVDLIMPELSGVETLARMKEMRPHLPVMIVTGNATEKLKKQAGCAGANKILEKPVDVADFLTEVCDLLERCGVSERG